MITTTIINLMVLHARINFTGNAATAALATNNMPAPQSRSHSSGPNTTVTNNVTKAAQVATTTKVTTFAAPIISTPTQSSSINSTKNTSNNGSCDSSKMQKSLIENKTNGTVLLSTNQNGEVDAKKIGFNTASQTGNVKKPEVHCKLTKFYEHKFLFHNP